MKFVGSDSVTVGLASITGHDLSITSELKVFPDDMFGLMEYEGRMSITPIDIDVDHMAEWFGAKSPVIDGVLTMKDTSEHHVRLTKHRSKMIRCIIRDKRFSRPVVYYKLVHNLTFKTK